MERRLIIAALIFLYCTLSSSMNCSIENQVYYDPIVAPHDTHCILGCAAGCYCKKGYAFNPKEQRCIEQNHPGSIYCPDEMYVTCGDVICSNLCAQSRDPLCSLSRFKCGYECFCKPEYIQVVGDECMPAKDCPEGLV